MGTVSATREIVSRSVGAADQWTEPLRLFQRELADVSVSGTFVATVSLQRRVDGSNWRTVKDYTEPAEDVMEAGGLQDVRVGVATGDFTSGTAVVSVSKG